MKKFAPLILIVFLLSCDTGSTPTAPTVQLYTAALTPDVTNPTDCSLYVGEITAQSGTQVTISIRVANIQNFANMVVVFNFPPNALRLDAYSATNSVMQGVWGTDWDVTAQQAEGKVTITRWPGFTQGFTGSGIVVELRFDILAAGQASMWMYPYLVQDHNGDWIDIAVHGAHIQITAQ